MQVHSNLVKEVQLLTLNAATPHRQAGTNASWLLQLQEPHKGRYPTRIMLHLQVHASHVL